MKAILIVDIDDELLEDYENFYVDYDLRAERKDENVNESIRYVEDCPLKPMPLKLETIEVDSKLAYQVEGYNICIEDILGEEE